MEYLSQMMILFLSVNTVAFSQTAKISVNFTETPLSEVFAELGKQAKMVFLYDHKLVESKGKVSVKADNQELEKVLKEFLPALGLTYVFEDSVVVIHIKVLQRMLTGSLMLQLKMVRNRYLFFRLWGWSHRN